MSTAQNDSNGLHNKQINNDINANNKQTVSPSTPIKPWRPSNSNPSTPLRIGINSLIPPSFASAKKFQQNLDANNIIPTYNTTLSPLLNAISKPAKAQGGVNGQDSENSAKSAPNGNTNASNAAKTSGKNSSNNGAASNGIHVNGQENGVKKNLNNQLNEQAAKLYDPDIETKQKNDKFDENRDKHENIGEYLGATQVTESSTSSTVPQLITNAPNPTNPSNDTVNNSSSNNIDSKNIGKAQPEQPLPWPMPPQRPQTITVTVSESVEEAISTISHHNSDPPQSKLGGILGAVVLIGAAAYLGYKWYEEKRKKLSKQ
jgi:hypothetical protein